MMSKRERDKSWKEFERLVARIEAVLSPQGAVVRSPDRIRDLITGRLREVDGSIRYRIGSSSILITIESRERKRVDDDTWIEQLAKKREKIGAAKTIAVTSKDFSSSAVTSARLYGIELRRIADISDEDIARNWLSATRLTLTATFYGVEVQEMIGADGIPRRVEDLAPEIRNALEANDLDTIVLFSERENRTYTVRELIDCLDTSRIPLGGPALNVRVEMGFEPGVMSSRTAEGKFAVNRIKLSAVYKRREVTISERKLRAYSSHDAAYLYFDEGRAVLDSGEEYEIRLMLPAAT